MISAAAMIRRTILHTLAAAALPFYAVDPARHTVALTTLDGLLRNGRPPALGGGGDSRRAPLAKAAPGADAALGSAAAGAE